MNCIKKKAMFITAGFLGIGGYILYQNLKSRIEHHIDYYVTNDLVQTSFKFLNKIIDNWYNNSI